MNLGGLAVEPGLALMRLTLIVAMGALVSYLGAVLTAGPLGSWLQSRTSAWGLGEVGSSFCHFATCETLGS